MRQSAWTEFLQVGTWARTECHGGRPYFLSHNQCHRIEKCHAIKTKQTNQCHRRPAWASCRSGRTMSHRSGSTSNRPQFSQRV